MTGVIGLSFVKALKSGNFSMPFLFGYKISATNVTAKNKAVKSFFFNNLICQKRQRIKTVYKVKTSNRLQSHFFPEIIF